jgi:hypothetical protein
VTELRITSDAYALITRATTLSDDAMEAITEAARISGLWHVSCSRRIAKQLWGWFDACEGDAEVLPHEARTVDVCRRAKDMIVKALEED